MDATLPSVTTILTRVGLAPDFRFVPEDTLERARVRGKALHRAIYLLDKGTLDRRGLHPDLVGGLAAYEAFVAQTGHQAIASEIELIHPRWRFCGHPDRIGVHRGSQRAIFDWKMTRSYDARYVPIQLAAYRMLWNATHKEEPVELCIGVHLRRDGTFGLHELADPEAEQKFMAALIVYRELEARGSL